MMWDSRCGAACAPAAWLLIAIGCAGMSLVLATEPKPEQQNDSEPEVAAGSDLLKGKTPQEQWAWAQSVLPDLASLTPEPQAPDFARLGLDRNKVTLYAVGLELPMNVKQPPACMALQFVLKGGALETRVDINGKQATPDLEDNYSILRLGLMLDAHESFQNGDGLFESSGPDRLVSEVAATILRYEGRPADYAVLCATAREERECGGKTVACERCDPYVAEVPLCGTGAFGSRSSQHSCAACPPDPVGPYIDALNRMVQERRWMQVQPGSGPSFYTTLKSCKAAISG